MTPSNVEKPQLKSLGRHTSWGAPGTVVAFVLLNLQIPISVALGDNLNATVATTLLLFAVLMVFLCRGSRVAWTVLVLFAAFAVLSQPFAPAAWWDWALNLIGLALLLAPATRRHVWGARPREHEVPAT